MDKKTQTINFYNANAKSLADKFDKTGARVEDIARVFSLINKQNPNVLEIGCGNGRDATEILKKTNKYLGIDISSEMLKLAKDRVRGGNFALHGIENYDFPNCIDIIFAFASLLHVNKDTLKTILEKANKALNPDGIFFLSLKYGAYHKETQMDEGGARTFWFYTPELIIKIAGDGYASIFDEIQEFRGQRWFTIILKKI